VKEGRIVPDVCWMLQKLQISRLPRLTLAKVQCAWSSAARLTGHHTDSVFRRYDIVPKSDLKDAAGGSRDRSSHHFSFSASRAPRRMFSMA
jgi:hypothetical protein